MNPAPSHLLLNRPWKRDLLFLLSFVTVFLFLKAALYLHMEPSGPHTWRQADCTSIIDNYYSHGMRFFWPEIHYQISDDDTTGYTAGEFPGLYYLNAGLWKIFGKHPFIPRAVSLLLTFLGLFALYRSMMLWTRNTFWSICWPLLIYVCPTIAEYGMNFLTDVPAFAFALMGWYFFSRFYFQKDVRSLWFSMTLFMIAGLLKVSSLILFISIGAVFILELLGVRFGKERSRLFHRPAMQFIPFTVVLLGVIAWYVYADYYNDLHGGRYTFNSTWPIWKLEGTEIERLATAFSEWTAPFVMPVAFWYALVPLLLGWFVALWRVPRFIGLISILSLLGVLAYFALWYQAIDQHDYYFANAFVLLVVMPLPYLTSEKNWPVRFRHYAEVLGVAALIYGTVYTRHNLELRHAPVGSFSYPLMPNEPVQLMKWYHWERTTRIRALGDINPMLDSLGVTKEKKVLIMPDATFNHTLYLIDRKGWTSFGTRPYRQLVDDCMQHGAEFLIVLHPDVFFEEGMGSIRQFRIGQLENAEVIDLVAFRDAGAPN